MKIKLIFLKKIKDRGKNKLNKFIEYCFSSFLGLCLFVRWHFKNKSCNISHDHPSLNHAPSDRILVDIIWKAKVSRKVKVFMWMCIQTKQCTNDRLQKNPRPCLQKTGWKTPGVSSYIVLSPIASRLIYSRLMACHGAFLTPLVRI